MRIPACSSACTNAHPALASFRCQPPAQRAQLRTNAKKGFGPEPPPTEPVAKRERQEPRGTKLRVPDKLVPQMQKQEGENFGDRLQSTLGSCSVVFVGSDGRLNNAVAEKFATVAGYTPLKTSTIVEKASGMTTEALVREQGTDHVVVTEISILEQLGSMIRCSIGTMGDSWGATARIAAYTHLYGSIIVWIDTHMDQTEEDAPERGAYLEAEIHIQVESPASSRAGSGGDSPPSTTTASGAVIFSFEDDYEKLSENVVAQVLPAMFTLIEKDPDLPRNKLLYIKLGSRGDWPRIMPPSWVPGDPVPDDA